MQHSEENGCKYTVVKNKNPNPDYTEYNIECGNRLFTIDELNYLILHRPFNSGYDEKKLYPPEIQHIHEIRDNHCDKEATEREKKKCQEKSYKQFLQTKIAKLKNKRGETFNVPFYRRTSYYIGKSLNNTRKNLSRRLSATNNRGGKTRKQKHKKRRRPNQ